MADHDTDTTPNPSIFHDLHDFVAEPRITGLFLSPVGQRLLAARTELNTKKNGYVTSLWELPFHPFASDVPIEAALPRRLTRGLEGEALAGFTAHGDVLFTGKRETGNDDESVSELFLLPRDGGEAFVVADRPGGFSSLTVARDTGRIALASPVHPRATSDEDDREIAKERKDSKISAILHTGYPVRRWDQDLGPAQDQIFVAEPLDFTDPDAGLELRQLTHFGPAERLGEIIISADGSTVYATLVVTLHGTTQRCRVIAVDVESADVRTVAASDDAHLGVMALSPDSNVLLVERSTVISDQVPLANTLMRADLHTGELHEVYQGFTDWPESVQISPDNTTAYFTADYRGRGAVYSVDLASAQVHRLTEGDHFYSSLALDIESGAMVALANAINQPPLPVLIDATGNGGGAGANAVAEDPSAAGGDQTEQHPGCRITPIPCGIQAPTIPGTLTEVGTTAADGTPLRGWLCLPEDASSENPAPLLLWVHGGPFGSWNSWTWRWNPWTATARGYAVLLPDPAISTGYGQEMLDRGWDQLGGSPYEDIMALTHVTLERSDIDESRKAALGGSYGGYMANWIAGHTGDFFDCIVTHASLWDLNQFRTTTDTAGHWAAHLTDAHNAKYNPSESVQNITQPMLVIHGDKDYRVPIGEGLRLWFELLSAADQSPEENPHRFLYFPDENHWILSPNNSVIWYETVFAFVDQHVRGSDTPLPRLLG